MRVSPFSGGDWDKLEIGLYAIENKAHVHDIHATILYLLGLDHERLTFPHNGRDERLTITSRQVIKGIVA